MNYRSLCLLALASLSAPLCAQDSKPPLPEGPLLKRAPNFSTWTVTVQGHAQASNPPSKTGTTGEGSPKDKEPATVGSTVIKTGSTILEQTVDADGKQHQIWHVSGLRIVSVPGSSNPEVCPDYASADIYSIDFASTDFAGLYWLSPSTYVGIVKYQGNDCIVFKGSVSPLGAKAQFDEQTYIQEARGLGLSVPDALRVTAVAYIDLASRLPVYVQFGQEKRVYQYHTPPTDQLALPSQFQGPVKEYAQHISNLSTHASIP